ncbi:PAS domain S-box-containing protein [Pontibacter aydingkolensis]|uniref:histidine kinase n=1 Tax=Pontibacter aydingkolensis TaxID=1911536 RepID=A0ABS7CW71_9BACT|nr:PAS domain-containing sensor histidine kinase [Pontibacter aydingkolensis]MBW7468077.1 PAS domain-containing sensor histidine kinase [Pontibacter aydingkolensis]
MFAFDKPGVLEKLINATLDIFGCVDSSGCFVFVSDAVSHILGYKSEELAGKHFSSFLHPDDIARTNLFFNEVLNLSHEVSFNNRYIHKRGYIVHMYWSGVWIENKNMLYFVGRDITEQRLGIQQLQEKDELHRALVEHGTDMLALFDENVHFTYSGGSTERLLGYPAENLLGVNAFSLIHPDDVEMVQEKLVLALKSEEQVTISDIRFLHANGKWRRLETSLSNQLHNPAVRALVTSSRDVTDKYRNRQRLIESEQRFKSLFDNSPDAVLVENREGIILEANQAAESLLGLPKYKILHRPVFDFLPANALEMCAGYLEDAFNGKTVKFILTSEFEGAGKLVLEITKIPVKVDGEVLAVHSIVKDITAVTNYHETVELHAKKLTTIFESITDAFCTIGRDWKYTYANSEFERLTRSKKEEFIGKSFFELYQDSPTNIFYKNYRYAMQTGSSVHFEAYSTELGMWLSVRAFPSEEGLSIYFVDITDRVEAQRELQQLSLVARHTTNCVIITNAARKVEWVNDSFTKLTGYSLEEALGTVPAELLQAQHKDEYPLEAVKDEMLRGTPISREVCSRRKDGELIWFSLQVNPVFGEHGEIVKFVTILTDITERIKSQQELEMLSLVASGTDNAVIIMNADGLTEWVNVGFTKMTGYTIVDLAGRKPGEVLRGEETDNITLHKLCEKLKEGVHFNVMIAYYRKSGEKFWASIDTTPIFDNNGIVTRFVAIQKDITYKKEAEENLLRMTQDLNRQNTDLQQFTYIVSHNLRAPVANAIGLANLLSKVSKDNALYDASLAHLKQSVEQLDIVLKDMNTILSVRDGNGNLELEKISIKLVVEQALSTLEESLKKCDGEVLLTIADNLEVKANKAYLYSIFYNLLSNAIKYRASDRRLRVEVKCQAIPDKGVLVIFSDNGSGFDMDKARDNVFKLYKRFHQNKNGRGIGLYLVKTHLEAMGGNINVTSKTGVGTSFQISIP